ncbi:MAG: GHKL domain-containing protein [Desulfobacteraceae bacterium]|nr:GHKL domain-containing protein [Desulfobacteraceae bacterium]MBC2758084.1 GHKL domain-containing protein [Desulfobacteraceae bacterium]
MNATAQENKGTEKFSRIRRIILTRVLLAPFIILMIVCSTLVYYFATNLFDRVESELIRVADDHRYLIEQFFSERTEDLQFIAGANHFKSIHRQDRLADIFQVLQSTSPAFLDLGVFDKKGNHIAYEGPYRLEGKNYSQAEWFKAVCEKSVYISDVFLGYRNTPHFIIAVKKVEDGESWYLRATIDTQFFNNLVENIRVGKTGEAYLINKDGVLQTRKRSGGSLMDIDPDFLQYQSDHHRIMSFTARDHQGGKCLYATGRLNKTGWFLVVRQDFSDAATPLIRAVLVAIGLVFIGGAVVVLIAFFLASGLANRLTLADAEKREMGSQLIMAGKLAEVGEMSAGMAHEINNPLQVMTSEITMINDLFEDCRTGEPMDKETLALMAESVDQIGLQINRCSNITQGLLKFARKTDPVVRKVVPREMIGEIVAMVEHQAHIEGITIHQEVDPDLPEIESDPAQLQQVFLNLLNNAIFAVKDRDDGEIRITSELDDEFVLLAVADNGCGIDPDQLKKIFVPFFTTKPVGKGTGLGLSTCYGIIEHLGGNITVTSELNVGTVFTVQLPISGLFKNKKR